MPSEALCTVVKVGIGTVRGQPWVRSSSSLIEDPAHWMRRVVVVFIESVLSYVLYQKHPQVLLRAWGSSAKLFNVGCRRQRHIAIQNCPRAHLYHA